MGKQRGFKFQAGIGLSQIRMCRILNTEVGLKTYPNSHSPLHSKSALN
jgi:hypothetical protein